MTTPYVTNAEGDTYFSEQLNVTAWTGAIDGDKTISLKMATRAINVLNYRGELAVSTQDNQFPRKDDTEVPQDIKDACCEIAIRLLEGLDPELEYENLRMIKQQIANIKSTYVATVPEHIIAGIPSIRAWRLLKPYLCDHTTVTMHRVS